jgi:carbamoyltransferase
VPAPRARRRAARRRRSCGQPDLAPDAPRPGLRPDCRRSSAHTLPAAFPSCGDESLPIGAYYLAAATRCGHAAVEPLADCFLGDDISDEEASAALAGAGYAVDRPLDVDAVAALLARREIVARAAGRMEFGARALGNRSILANPADADLPRVLNRLIKRRDFWMPFAPAVLASTQHDYLINPKRLASPL